MMGRKQKLNGDEVDAVSKKARAVLKNNHGKRKKIKKKLNKRARKEGKKIERV